jgi:chromosome segregation ATPase
MERLRETVRELTAVRGEFVPDEDRDAKIRLLQHTVEAQRADLEKARVMLTAAAAPVGRRPRVAMAVTPPRTTVSILDEAPPDNDAPAMAEDAPAMDDDRARRALAARDREIARLRETVARMAADFAVVHDRFGAVAAEKDAALHRLLQIGGGPHEAVAADAHGIEEVRREMREMQDRYEAALAEKDRQIEQLRARAAPQPCQGCKLLEQKLADVVRSAQEEAEALRTRIAELERAHTQGDAQAEKVRRAAPAQQNELRECRRKLEEAERRLRAGAEAEERCRAVVDQLKAEQVAMRNDLRSKTAAVRALSERGAQAQKQIQELQEKLQRAKDDATRIAARRDDPHVTVGRDATSMVQALQVRLREKEQECESYEKLLEQTQGQLLPLTETTIPRLKAQIANLQREKDEGLRKTKRLAQLGYYLEQVIESEEDRSPEVAAFFSLLHQIEAEHDRR